jgi:hypothetical protein
MGSGDAADGGWDDLGFCSSDMVNGFPAARRDLTVKAVTRTLGNRAAANRPSYPQPLGDATTIRISLTSNSGSLPTRARHLAIRIWRSQLTDYPDQPPPPRAPTIPPYAVRDE